jgi:exonuclease III
MQELAEQIGETQLEILAIQEIRWCGIGLIKKHDYSLYYSGSSSKTGQGGTGLILLKKMHNHVIGFEPYNERLCKLRIKGTYSNIKLINVYAAAEDHTEETKEQFYELHPTPWTHSQQPHTRPPANLHKVSCATCYNLLYSLELLMMGIIVPETC